MFRSGSVSRKLWDRGVDRLWDASLSCYRYSTWLGKRLAQTVHLGLCSLSLNPAMSGSFQMDREYTKIYEVYIPVRSLEVSRWRPVRFIQLFLGHSYHDWVWLNLGDKVKQHQTLLDLGASGRLNTSRVAWAALNAVHDVSKCDLQRLPLLAVAQLSGYTSSEMIYES